MPSMAKLRGVVIFGLGVFLKTQVSWIKHP